MTFDALNSETNKLKAQGKLILRNAKHENSVDLNIDDGNYGHYPGECILN